MSLSAGIVGLPNVGKSTIFNALSAAGAPSANYPFCTIEPNVGIVPVVDKRLDAIWEIAGSTEKVYNDCRIVDIAGLVKGASKGEGLGNQFLANIRETDAIIHVVRCFENENVVHVEGSVDPVRDIDVIETELLLADLETLTKRIERVSRQAKAGKKEDKAELEILGRVLKIVEDGTQLRAAGLSDDEKAASGMVNLLTIKPVIYVANIAEGDIGHESRWVHSVRELAEERGGEVVTLAGDIEAQIVELPEEERAEFLAEEGLEEPGLSVLVRGAYRLLDLETFFTAGPKQARAWDLRVGAKAPEAAGQIHTDFERGFIRAETISYDDYIAYGGEHGARAAGRMRSEGRDYVVQDGDVILFRFNV